MPRGTLEMINTDMATMTLKTVPQYYPLMSPFPSIQPQDQNEVPYPSRGSKRSGDRCEPGRGAFLHLGELSVFLDLAEAPFLLRLAYNENRASISTASTKAPSAGSAHQHTMAPRHEDTPIPPSRTSTRSTCDAMSSATSRCRTPFPFSRVITSL